MTVGIAITSNEENTVRISQIELIAAIGKHLETQGITTALCRQHNAIIEAANIIIASFKESFKPVIPGMGAMMWQYTDETGLSSLYMLSQLTELQRYRRDQYQFPRDPADFSRCLGLLKADSSLREKLPIMAACGKEWAALVGKWDELETLFNEELPSGVAPRTFALMESLLNP